MELEPRTTAPAHATGAVEFVPFAEISDDATFRLREEGDVSSLAASFGRLGQLVPIEVRPFPGAEPGAPRFQVVTGFRRIAAARLLARERVLARVHAQLSDSDAWGLALGQALLDEPLLASELEALGERLRATGVAPWAEELVPDALARAPVEPRQRERFLEFLARAEEDARPAVEAEARADGEARTPADAGAEARAGAPDTGANAVGTEAGGTPEREAGAPAEADRPEEVTAEALAEDLARRMFEVNQDLALAYDAWAELPSEGRRMIVAQARYVAELLALLGEGEP